MSDKKSAILESKDLGYEDVAVPEWGVTIRVKQLDAGASIDMNAEVEKAPKDGMFIILVRAGFDPDTDEPIFTVEDIPALKKKSMRVLNRLQKIALRLNSPNEAALKNGSGGAPTGASPSDSPKS